MEKILEAIKFDMFDIESVGDHYWGGDYEPSINELKRMADIFNEKLEEKYNKLFN
jgi:hypothetical protein